MDPSETQPSETISTPEQAFAHLHKEIREVAARQADTEQQLQNALKGIQQQLAALLLPSPSPPPPVRTPPPTRSTNTRVRVAVPSDFDGDRARGRAFLNSCSVYLRLCNDQFEDDQQRILWAMSYMKSGRAAAWADGIFRWEDKNPGAYRFVDWDDFADTFRTHFFPADSEGTAVNTLEGAAYYQRSRNVDDYLDEFRTLISDSGYTDPKVIVIKFRRGLQPAIQNAVATMTANRPSDVDYEGWYAAARRVDQVRSANEVFQSLSRTEPSHRPKPPAPVIRLPPSVPPPAPVRNTSSLSPSPGNPVPMDIDAARKKVPLPPTCFRCKQAGHVRADCPLRFDVRQMTIEEREDWIQQLLADKDARRAAEVSEVSESEEDFA